MGLIESKEPITKAIAVFTSDKISGNVLFTQELNKVRIFVDLSGLGKKHKHGFHIHEAGDLREGCKSLCAHYNPHGKSHGGLRDDESHAGDLGNLVGNEYGKCHISMTTNKFTVQEIIGRSLIIHEDEDDLGLGNHEDSKTTGHSGARIACALIGIAKKCN